MESTFIFFFHVEKRDLSHIFFPIICSHLVKLLEFTSCILQKREGSVCFSLIYAYILRWITPIIHSSCVHTKTSHKTKKHFSLKGNLLYVRKKVVKKTRSKATNKLI